MVAYSHSDHDLNTDFPTLNDHVYSAWNNSNYTFCIYYNAEYAGPSTTIPPGTKGDLGADFANNVSSLRIKQSYGC